ncbi:MAG: hypothetical protein GQ535_01410 [Rhodobacteraceae bacterium]|nr:hypothetical protein [Paracoccaceae bacterium]
MPYKFTPKRLAVALSATSAAAIILGVTTTTFTAHAEMRGFDQTGFSEIRVGAGLEMVVEVGPAFSIAAEGETDAIDTVVIRMEGAALVVDRKRNWRAMLNLRSQDQQQVQLTVSLPVITALNAGAGAHIEISGEFAVPLQATASAGASLRLNGLDGADIVITASSGASVRANGVCAALQAEARSGASIQAPMLACAAVTADAKSGASVEVNGSETLSLGASGGGSVFAHGQGSIMREDMRSGGSITVKR